MKAKTDEELMSQYAQEGDEEAFSELYRRYAPKLYGYLNKNFATGTDKDAVFQETFMKLHQAKENYRAEYPFSAWLFAICRNTLVDHLRKERRMASGNEEFRLGQEGYFPEMSPRVQIPEQVLAQLPTDQRLALELRYLQELPFEAIARDLKKSEQNVRQLVSRAVRRLRRLLEKH